jgi:hypothetical protein
LGFVNDIRAVVFRGKGRGKGFVVANDVSILYDNDCVRKIRDRTLSIISLFLHKGLVSESYVLEKLGVVVPEAEPEEPEVVTEVVADTDLEEAAESAERKVYDAMDLDYDRVDQDVPLPVRLRSAVDKLVKDYLDFRDVMGT